MVHESESGVGTGIKEKNNKVSFVEIDWDFITQMAARMNQNKDKYPPNNWKKGISSNDLKDSITRHVSKMWEDSPFDPESVPDHLVAIACNTMMLYYQLIKNSDHADQRQRVENTPDPNH